MSSPPKENPELKGGHPPAVKVGGMRITQNKPPRESGDGAASKEKEEVDDTTNALSVSTSPPKTMSVSGAPVKGNADFPTEAVQSFHDKPQPTHDSRPASRPNIIHQPRK